MMTSFDYKYQNALRQAIVFSVFSFVKNRSCVTQSCSEMHSGSCSQIMSSHKCPIPQTLEITVAVSATRSIHLT